nr:glycosyltransferase [uncultured Cellulosilyticum sp.]
MKIIKDLKQILRKVKQRTRLYSYRCTYQKNVILMGMKKITTDDLVSVVIPIYDRTNELIESIESILSQSYENIEVILVCDGSPKETIDIVKRYEAKPNVRAFYYKNNSGNAVRGRNRGILEAKGKYIAFQDSDDIADKDRIKNSLKYLKQFDVAMVYGGWRAKILDRDIQGLENNQEVYSPECTLELLKTTCVMCQSTVLVTREALINVGLFKTDMRYREDHELWLRLWHNGYKFKMIPHILTNLRLHSNNLELRYKSEDEHWYKKTLEEYMNNPKLKPTIAYVIPGTAISGGIGVVCQHANRLLERGYQVYIISEDNNNEISWFPYQNATIVPLKEFDFEVDILIATAWSTAYTVQALKAKRKLYFVQSDESRFYEKSSFEYKQALNTYKMNFEYMTEAKWIKTWLKDEFNQECSYVPNGIDTDIIHISEPLEEKKGKFRILLEGAISSKFKGMEDAFKVVEDIDCEVWCVSSNGQPRDTWKCDRFFEKVDMNEMKKIYSSCDIFLKMSKVEGFFGPPLEMMACEGVCVVGKVTGYEEYIIDENNALVVESGDIEGAKKAIYRLMKDKDLREKLIKGGQATVKEWSWDRSIDYLEDVINKGE